MERIVEVHVIKRASGANDVSLRIATLRGERIERFSMISLADIEQRLARKGVDVSLLSEYEEVSNAEALDL